MATDIDAVVFDIGGVLLSWEPRLVYRSLLPDAEELDRFLAEVCTPAWNGELDAGRPFHEAAAALADEHPGHAPLIAAWARQDEMVGGEIAGSAALVARLEARGLPRYLLTNMPAEVFRARLERYDVLRRFDGAVVSGEEGVLKPAREIFEIAIERFGLEAGRTLFIDDAEVNVLGAAAVGFRTHRFVDAPTLEAALIAAGLLPAGAAPEELRSG